MDFWAIIYTRNKLSSLIWLIYVFRSVIGVISLRSWWFNEIAVREWRLIGVISNIIRKEPPSPYTFRLLICCVGTAWPRGIIGKSGACQSLLRSRQARIPLQKAQPLSFYEAQGIPLKKIEPPSYFCFQIDKAVGERWIWVYSGSINFCRRSDKPTVMIPNHAYI